MMTFHVHAAKQQDPKASGSENHLTRVLPVLPWLGGGRPRGGTAPPARSAPAPPPLLSLTRSPGLRRCSRLGQGLIRADGHGSAGTMSVHAEALHPLSCDRKPRLGGAAHTLLSAWRGSSWRAGRTLSKPGVCAMRFQGWCQGKADGGGRGSKQFSRHRSPRREL